MNILKRLLATSRISTLAAILVLTSQMVNAQNHKRDIVYLKNGSIVKGTVVEVIPNETVKLKTSDGSLFIFKMEEIERIINEEIPKEREPRRVRTQEVKNDANLEDVKPGYIFMLRFGPNLHVLNDVSLDVSFGIVNAYRLNRYFSVGIGVEATTLTYNQANGGMATLYPIYIDSRIYIPRENIQPMFNVQLGYSLIGNTSSASSTNNYGDFVPSTGSGGFFAAINVGMRVPISERFSVFTEGGLTLQQLRGVEDATPGIFQTVPSLRLNVGLCLSIGKNKKSAE
jgi:hypothetical protein